MAKVRVVVEMDEDVFDELCSYPERRVNIIFAEDASIPANLSDITINANEE